MLNFSDVNSNDSHLRHVCNYLLMKMHLMHDTYFVRDVLHTKFHLPNSSASLVTGSKAKADENVRVVAILLFYTLNFTFYIIVTHCAVWQGHALYQHLEGGCAGDITAWQVSTSAILLSLTVGEVKNYGVGVYTDTAFMPSLIKIGQLLGKLKWGHTESVANPRT